MLDSSINTPRTEKELLDNAFALTGMSMQQIALHLGLKVPENQLRAKGWVGELVENYLGATASSRPEPDFQDLGIELKTIPIDERGNPKESTHVCRVPLSGTIGALWDDSTVKLKLQRVLWVPIEATPSIPLSQRRVGKPFIWSPDQQQENYLRTDWQEHMDKINMGELHKVSSREGKYLQIRPKAADSRALSSTTVDTGETGMTLPRGFYLRPTFTLLLLDKYAYS